ncbi:MAG: hypothetical protein U0836_09260 [Pirellulales bacterium]
MTLEAVALLSLWDVGVKVRNQLCGRENVERRVFTNEDRPVTPTL